MNLRRNNGQFAVGKTQRHANESQNAFVQRSACGLLLIATAVAPWIIGAVNRWQYPLYCFGATLLVSGLLVAIDLRRTGISKSNISRTLWIAVSVILVLIAYWAVRGLPDFASEFTREQWERLSTKSPQSFLIYDQNQTLFFLAALLVTIPAAAVVGKQPWFRKSFILVAGLSGIAVAILSLGIRFLGWSHPSWLVLADGGPEGFNGTFFEYSATAACFNFAWPLLAIGLAGLCSTKYPRLIFWMFRFVVVTIFGSAIFGLNSESNQLIFVGLLAIVFILRFVRLPKPPSNTLTRITFASPVWLTLSGVLLLGGIYHVQNDDNWNGYHFTIHTMPERDAYYLSKANTRGDRLIPAETSVRPASWAAGIRMFASSPIVGRGPGSWTRHAAIYTNEPFVASFNQHLQFVHNDFLQTSAEQGAIALIAWISIWWIAMREQTLRISIDPTNRSEMGLTLALLGLVLASQVHYPLQVPALQLWAAIALGLCCTPAVNRAA